MSNKKPYTEAGTEPPTAVLLESLKAALELAVMHPPPVGVSTQIELPDYLAERAGRASIDVIQLVDSRIVILLKTWVGWKGNYRGILCLSDAVRSEEIKVLANGRRYIALPGPPPWEELYVQNKLSDEIWDVFFDLN